MFYFISNKPPRDLALIAAMTGVADGKYLVKPIITQVHPTFCLRQPPVHHHRQPLLRSVAICRDIAQEHNAVRSELGGQEMREMRVSVILLETLFGDKFTYSLERHHYVKTAAFQDIIHTRQVVKIRYTYRHYHYVNIHVLSTGISFSYTLQEAQGMMVTVQSGNFNMFYVWEALLDSSEQPDNLTACAAAEVKDGQSVPV